MTTFHSYKSELEQILPKIVSCPKLHAKWLNTLSYLENCGAKKIAACQHPTLVKEEMLKHASEEFRHAHYLKRQIERIGDSCEDYSLSQILGGTATLQYLSALDLKTSRFLSEIAGLPKSSVKEVAYLLVTFAIELRAEELYPLYDEHLRKVKSKVAVKSILLEEKEHLEEMRKGISHLSFGAAYANQICSFETELCKKWIEAVAKEIS